MGKGHEVQGDVEVDVKVKVKAKAKAIAPAAPMHEVVVPTGVVTIQNVKGGEYLYAADFCFNHDGMRRQVFTWSGQVEGAPPQKFRWQIEKHGDHYFIQNFGQDQEYLYAPANILFNDERRHVFTWAGPDKQGTPTPQSTWQICSVGHGEYTIKNFGKDEYLYAADFHFDTDGYKRRVFTWAGPDKHGAPTPRSKWRIVSS